MNIRRIFQPGDNCDSTQEKDAQRGISHNFSWEYSQNHIYLQESMFDTSQATILHTIQ